MNTKSLFLKLLFTLLSTCLVAQSYHINFTSDGESSTVDSVKVENLTQCTSINMSGSDILKLVPVIGIHDVENENKKDTFVYIQIPQQIIAISNFIILFREKQMYVYQI